MRYSTLLWIAGLLAASACSDAAGPASDLAQAFSFEPGLEGWQPKATDTELGDGQIEWSIEPSGERARSGDTSLKLRLVNHNDAGKIWVERAFDLAPNTEYDATLELQLASRDYGVNTFRIIAGVLPDSPDSRADLLPAFQGDTHNGGHEEYRWLGKSYTFRVRTGADGRLHAVVGVWGTWETERTYYVDDLRVTFRARS